MKNLRVQSGSLIRAHILTVACVFTFAFPVLAQEPVGNRTLDKQEKMSDLETIESDIDFESSPEKGNKAMSIGQNGAAVTIKPNATLDAKGSGSGFSYARPPATNEVREMQIIQINDSLRTLIEENEKVKTENENLDKQVKDLRGMVNFETNKRQNMTAERENYKTQSDLIIQLNKKSQTELEQMKNAVLEQEQALLTRMDKLSAKEKELTEKWSQSAVAAPGKGKTAVVKPAKPASRSPVKDDPKLTKDKEQILKMIDEMGRETQKMKMAQGKVHYNMGNMFFMRGDYEKAGKEYQQAVNMMPQDCSAHFNLAFVSSEYIRDYKTALEHYKQYLFLNPNADDANLVHEKIVEAELSLKAKIDSGLDDDFYAKNKYNRL